MDRQININLKLEPLKKSSEVEQLKNGKILADGSLTSDTGVGPKTYITLSVKPGKGVLTWTSGIMGAQEPKKVKPRQKWRQIKKRVCLMQLKHSLAAAGSQKR